MPSDLNVDTALTVYIAAIAHGSRAGWPTTNPIRIELIKTALHVHHEIYAVTCLEGLPQHRAPKFSHKYLTQSMNLVESVSS
jgi:hypothetical protein